MSSNVNNSAKQEAKEEVEDVDDGAIAHEENKQEADDVISSKQCYDNTIEFLSEELVESREAFFGSTEDSHFMALHLEELPADTVQALLDDILSENVATEMFELFALVSVTPHPGDDDDEVENKASMVSFACPDCNQVYDMPFRKANNNNEDDDEGFRYEDSSHPHLDIRSIGSTEWTPAALHRLLLLLQVVTKVLGSPTLRSNSDKNDLEQKLLMIDVGKRQGISRAAIKYFGSDGYWMDPSRFPLLDATVNFLHTRNCHYPLLSQNAAALLSLMIIRRPATILATKQYDQFICCIGTHLMQINNQMEANSAVHSVRFSVLAYINILPTLRNLTAADSARMLERGLHETIMELLQSLIRFAGRVLICARGDCTCYMTDEPPDYFQHRALFMWSSPVRNCFAVPLLLDDHPLSLAIVATVELLTRWKRFLPMTDMRETSFVTKQETVRLILLRRDRSLHHGSTLYSDLVLGTKTTKPYTSVFRNDVARCHFEACPETGAQLKACSGCTVKHQAIAWYCCAEHQRQHWPAHKPFCRLVKKASKQQRR